MRKIKEPINVFYYLIDGKQYRISCYKSSANMVRNNLLEELRAGMLEEVREVMGGRAVRIDYYNNPPDAL